MSSARRPTLRFLLQLAQLQDPFQLPKLATPTALGRGALLLGRGIFVVSLQPLAPVARQSREVLGAGALFWS